MKECFRPRQMSPERMAIIRQANKYIAELDGEPVSLRTIYYMFIGADTFPDDWIDEDYNREHGLDLNTKNTIKNYKRLGEILQDARYAGLVDWAAIDDRGREPTIPLEFDSLRDRVETAIRNFRLPRWADQERYVELWVEKLGQAALVGELANEFHVTLSMNKGYTSASAAYEAASRLRECSNGRPIVILYLGDHDPSGEDMVRDITDRLSEFGVENLEVRKVALTMPQIRRFKPPPNPAKITDSRAKRYIERHGDRSWETEALRPKQIREIVRASIVEVVDIDLMNAVIEQENRGKEQLREALKRIK